MALPLSSAEIVAALAALPGWRDVAGALVKEFRFADFRAAMAFLVRGAFEAEELNHHPEWTNVYNRVTVRLNTHDADNRITAKDVELARRLERCATPGSK